MRTETTTRTLYTFDELDEQAQDTALQKLWDLNVDSEWWDVVSEDINEFGKASGLGCTYGGEFDLDRASSVHIEDLRTSVQELDAHRQQAHDFPNISAAVLEPFFATFSARQWRQLCRLERAGVVGTLSGETSSKRRGIRYDVERWDRGEHTPRVTALLDRLETAWQELLGNLEQVYLTMLRDEYDYQTSPEAITRSILAQGYEFEADGTLAY